MNTQAQLNDRDFRDQVRQHDPEALTALGVSPEKEVKVITAEENTKYFTLPDATSAEVSEEQLEGVAAGCHPYWWRKLRYETHVFFAGMTWSTYTPSYDEYMAGDRGGGRLPDGWGNG